MWIYIITRAGSVDKCILCLSTSTGGSLHKINTVHAKIKIYPKNKANK